MTIGEYLRDLRAHLHPADLGLPHAGRRRVPGLRREEVAVLAGISADYYRRLEQGRERSPSAQIIEALARGLDLPRGEREHLFRLAGYTPPQPQAPSRVQPELDRLLGRWSAQAAYVHTGTLDVLAPNPLARALLSPLPHCDNLARAVFLDSAARAFYPDWEHVAHNTVAVLRHNSTRVSSAIFDPFLDELQAASETFREMWARPAVCGKTHGAKRFHHPVVGPMTLQYQALDVPEEPGHQVIIYDAEPGSASAEAFDLLRIHAHLEETAPGPGASAQAAADMTEPEGAS